MRYRYIFLLLDKFRGGTVAITYATGINTTAIFHLRQAASSFVARQKLIDRVTHSPLMTIQRFGCSSCERENEFLAFELVPGASVRETVTESLFHPAFQYGGCGVPEKGEL